MSSSSVKSVNHRVGMPIRCISGCPPKIPIERGRDELRFECLLPYYTVVLKEDMWKRVGGKGGHPKRHRIGIPTIGEWAVHSL